MALTEKREEAERLYTCRSMPCHVIARELGVNEGTVYRWRKDAAKKGEYEDWDVKRRSLSPVELIITLTQALMLGIAEIRKNPELIFDPKKADALTKNLAVLQKIDIRGQYLHVMLDLVKVINTFLAENDPDLKRSLEPYWDRIHEEMIKYAERPPVVFK
jgi:transposase-like protein